MTGSLAPPPPYGSEQGSILLEAGREGAQASQGNYPSFGHTRSRSRFGVIGGPMSPGPIRSPTDISLAHLAHIPSHEDVGEGTSRGVGSATTAVQDEGESRPPPPAAADRNDFSVPPPEYTSPEASRRTSNDSEVDERRPLMREEQPRPPIPSYAAAVGRGPEELDSDEGAYERRSNSTG